MVGDHDELLARLRDSSPLEMQHVLDAFPYYVLVVDEDHRIIAANSHIYGHVREPHKVIGSYCPYTIHGADGPIEHCPLEDAVSTDTAQERELFDEASGTWTLSAVYPLYRRSLDGRRLFLHTALDITAHKESERRERAMVQRMHGALMATVNVTARAVEAKDPYTAGHQRRVAELSTAIAEHLGLPTDSVDAVRMAATVHDLGKIGIPSEILNKPGRLTGKEFERIRQHPEIGSAILAPAEFPWPIADIVLQHHERMDGSGYPKGLAGDEIMLEARIIAVADVVEAMSLERPYRGALGLDAALEHVARDGRALFDPDVADACVSLFNRGFAAHAPSGSSLFGAA